MSRGVRLTAYNAVSTSLALCSDPTLHELLEAALPMGAGIGGKSALEEGVQVRDVVRPRLRAAHVSCGPATT